MRNNQPDNDDDEVPAPIKMIANMMKAKLEERGECPCSHCTANRKEAFIRSHAYKILKAQQFPLLTHPEDAARNAYRVAEAFYEETERRMKEKFPEDAAEAEKQRIERDAEKELQKQQESE